jgi:glutathione synthase/RimK-type ligase-like ATP-grasp enzyme
VNTIRRVGLLTGRERSFPDALIAEVARRDAGVIAEYASVDATAIDRPLPYDVIVDRISHEVTSYQPVLKHAVLFGAKVVNNPFWRIADDKFFNTALAQRVGVAVPKTYVLPSKAYGPDVSSATLHNLRYPLAWEQIARELGFPMFMKPHWGGGWRDVHRVDSMEQLFAVYDGTGQLTMIVQEAIEWTQYVRCIVVGREHVRPALWDPRRSHFDRYTEASAHMEPLAPALEARVIDDARKLCRALGYDMNTVEFAIRDGVPYAIDFMNSAPDFDVSSLGPEHFAWVVEKMAGLVIDLAKSPERGQAPEPSWDAMLRG